MTETAMNLHHSLFESIEGERECIGVASSLNYPLSPSGITSLTDMSTPT